MDSTKEYSNYPKWPKEKGTSYFPIFVHELCSFMCRNGLMIFAHQTVADMPAEFPTGTTTTRHTREEFIAEYPDIDTPAKYKHASAKAWGYLDLGLKDFPELREAIKGHPRQYVQCLQVIERHISGNPGQQIYHMRKIKYAAILATCTRRSDIPNAINQMNTLNFEIESIDATRKFADLELREDLLHIMSGKRYELVDVHHRAFSEPGLATWSGLCSHLNDIIRPDDTKPTSHIIYGGGHHDRGTALVADKANKGPSCFKCGASGPDFHRSKDCKRPFIPCSAPGCDQRHTHCIDFHEKVMQIAERNKKKQAGTDVAVADKPMHYMNL